MFFYDFKSMEGVEHCCQETSDTDFDETKIDDEKYIRSFLKKYTKSYIDSCKIVSCEKYCEWFVKIVVDLSSADINDLIGKKIDILTLNYLIHNIDKDKYENVFDFDGKTISKLREKYYKRGYLYYEDNKLKITFEKIGNKKEPYLVKVVSIES